MNTVQERIGELEELLAKAQEVDGEERDRRAALRAIESQRKKAIKGLQGMIKEGQSSGDAALDIEIMFGNSIARTGRYLRLVWLQAAINRHPDDLIILRTNRWHWEMGLLPKSPTIDWQIDLKGTYKNVEVAVQRSCWDPNGGYELLPRMYEEPLRVMHHLFEPGLRAFELEGDIADCDRRLEIAVGSEAVQQWMETLEVRTALQIYIAARLLGRPLQLYPELAREIRDRRERFIPTLIEEMDKLKSIEDKFWLCMHKPAEALHGGWQYKVAFTPQSEGVITIDFGIAEPLKKQKNKLWTIVENAAVGLEMGDNFTLQQAAKMIDFDLPS